MAQEDGSELVRLDPYEQRLIRNFRKVNEVRQDTLLFFSDELVKLEIEDAASDQAAAPTNVVRLVNRKLTPKAKAKAETF